MSDQTRSTAVDAGIIHDVARTKGMGAGALKGLLERVDSSDDLDDLSSREEDAVRRALRRHGVEAVETVRDAWEGTAAYSEEFDAVVTVETVHDPHGDEVLDDVQPVDIAVDGRTETTSLATLWPVTDVTVTVTLDASEAYEVSRVLAQGLSAMGAEDAPPEAVGTVVAATAEIYKLADDDPRREWTGLPMEMGAMDR